MLIFEFVIQTQNLTCSPLCFTYFQKFVFWLFYHFSHHYLKKTGPGKLPVENPQLNFQSTQVELCFVFSWFAECIFHCSQSNGKLADMKFKSVICLDYHLVIPRVAIRYLNLGLTMILSSDWVRHKTKIVTSNLINHKAAQKIDKHQASR